MFHWLSDDIVTFKIEVGVEEKTLTHAKWPFLQQSAPQCTYVLDGERTERASRF